ERLRRNLKAAAEPPHSNVPSHREAKFVDGSGAEGTSSTVEIDGEQYDCMDCLGYGRSKSYRRGDIIYVSLQANVAHGRDGRPTAGAPVALRPGSSADRRETAVRLQKTALRNPTLWSPGLSIQNPVSPFNVSNQRVSGKLGAAPALNRVQPRACASRF
ncbi:MAG TPA: hypothetical protein VEU30_04470, partial [Thermoanaerobaculia bacterium]|nr:hypothetical protein [Thermoanaerobaculia bacterium]